MSYKNVKFRWIVVFSKTTEKIKDFPRILELEIVVRGTISVIFDRRSHIIITVNYK